MPREKVYLETSVISYLAARPSRDVFTLAKQEMTRRWWEKNRTACDFFVSDSVMYEILSGDEDAAARRLDVVAGLPVITATDALNEFHRNLFSTRIFPEKAKMDAMHLVLAAGHGMDYLVTWNCRHINNAVTKPKMRSEILKAGYNDVVIATPAELWRM